MRIADRLRQLRQERDLSQGDIEARTGILRCYVSRVENGHTTPSVETLEKLVKAMELSLYHFFYDGDGEPALLKRHPPKRPAELLWGESGSDARMLADFRRHLSQASERDRLLLLKVARTMVRENQKSDRPVSE